MDTQPRIVIDLDANPPVLRDAFGLPHSAANLRDAIASLENQIALIDARGELDDWAANTLMGAITMRRAWLALLTTSDVEATL